MTPRPQEKRFRKDSAPQMLRIARADLETAEALEKLPRVRKENAAFHAQQTVEKALKAVLVALGIPVPLVHDAGILVAKLPDGITPPRGYDLSELTAFATVRRYEEGTAVFTAEELSAVIAVARGVLEWAEKQVTPPAPSSG